MLQVTEKGLEFVRDGSILASCKLTMADGHLTVHDLEGYGHPEALISIIRKLKEISLTQPVHAFIDGANPDYESLLALYKRAGMSVLFTLLRS